MNRLKYIYLYLTALLFAAGASSCADDIIDGKDTPADAPFSGTLMLKVEAAGAGISSRSVNLNDGATVNINSLWVGVYNKETGEKIGSTQIDGFNQSVTSGTIARNTITVDFFADYANPEMFVVGIANYEDVTTWDGTPIIDAVRSAATLKELVEIDVDVVSAYAGDKGENAASQSPFLMGYFLESQGSTRIPKFDQFAAEKSEPLTFYPENALSAMTIKLFTDEKDQLYVPAGALTLRRLVTNVNVKLVTGPGIEISDVSYKIFNQPQLVYLVQRRTDTTPNRSYDDWKRLSPNCADRYVASSGALSGTPAYVDDRDWRTDISSDGKSFSFQHFENKHWGFGEFASFSQREAKNSDGTLRALSPGAGQPYNDYASYFKIRMHVTDNNTGKSGDVTYTIHEGLCNTDDGRKAETEAEKLKDFGSFRNVNYSYTININGLEKIVVNASLDQDDDHNYGQEGSVWQLLYANGSQRQIPDTGGTYGQVTFNRTASPAFRIYGTDDDGRLYDVCYNFPQNGESLLGGFWPEGSAATVFTNNPSDLLNLPQSLLADLKVTDGSRDYTIEEFLASADLSKTYSFKFNRYNGPWEDEPRENMRALYLFDKNEYQEDFDDCSSFGKIYIAEQYPYDNRPTIAFNKSNVIGHTAFHTTAENKWCGMVNSVIDLAWVHDTSFEGYFIEVGGFREKITKEQLPSLIKTVNGKQAVVYPYVTDRLAASESTYDITITPIPVDKKYKGAPTVITGTLAVYPSNWQAKTTPLWKDLDLNGKTLFDVEYRGLEMSQNQETKNASSKGNYWSFGGSSNTTTRVIRFYTVKSGKLTVTCCSNAALPSGASSNAIDESRYLIAYLIKYDEAGNQVTLKTISKEDEHVPYSNKTADRVFDIVIDEPCYVYVGMSGGNIRVHGIKFDAY